MKQEQRLIEVVPYDVNWPLQFVEEAKLIKHALGANCIETLMVVKRMLTIFCLEKYYDSN